MDVITYQCWDLSLSMLVKGAPELQCIAADPQFTTFVASPSIFRLASFEINDTGKEMSHKVCDFVHQYWLEIYLIDKKLLGSLA